MDQISKPSGQVLNNEDSDSGYHSTSENTTSSISAIQSSAGVIISRIPLPLLLATTRSTSTAESSNVTLTDITEHIGSICLFSGSRSLSNPAACTAPSLSLFLFSHFPLFRIPRGLPDLTHRSLLPGNRGLSSQVVQASTTSLDEIGLQNGTDIDLMRQQYVESALFLYRLTDSLLEGSMSSLMILAADTEVNSRLASQDIQVIRQSRWISITETQDHYRDMRLDVDNMSYEELLALEDHIGNVNTGLSDEGVIMSLSHSKFYLFAEEHAQKECCSICQEDYEENDELGTLNCGHGFHTDCIKQWLRCKNLCPICKSTGLDTTYPSFSQSQSQ